MLLVDIPFMVLRSMIIGYNGYWAHALIVFFLFKNVLMIIAAIYKFFSIKFEYDKHLQHLIDQQALKDIVKVPYIFDKQNEIPSNFDRQSETVTKTRL